MRTDETQESERQVLHRATRTITGGISVVITGLVLLVGTLAYVLMLTGQKQDVQRELDLAAQRHSGMSPPGCVWLYTEQGGAVTRTGDEPPAGFPITADLRSAAATGQTVRSTVEANRTEYSVRTQVENGVVVQAVYDERYQLADRHS